MTHRDFGLQHHCKVRSRRQLLVLLSPRGRCTAKRQNSLLVRTTSGMCGFLTSGFLALVASFDLELPPLPLLLFVPDIVPPRRSSTPSRMHVLSLPEKRGCPAAGIGGTVTHISEVGVINFVANSLVRVCSHTEQTAQRVTGEKVWEYPFVQDGYDACIGLCSLMHQLLQHRARSSERPAEKELRFATDIHYFEQQSSYCCTAVVQQ